MPQSIHDKVIQVVKDVLDIREETDVLNASIVNELAPTSLDQMALFIALEDEFQRTIPQKDVEGFDTVQEIIHYIEERFASSEY